MNNRGGRGGRGGGAGAGNVENDVVPAKVDVDPPVVEYEQLLARENEVEAEGDYISESILFFNCELFDLIVTVTLQL